MESEDSVVNKEPEDLFLKINHLYADTLDFDKIRTEILENFDIKVKKDLI